MTTDWKAVAAEMRFYALGIALAAEILKGRYGAMPDVHDRVGQQWDESVEHNTTEATVDTPEEPGTIPP